MGIERKYQQLADQCDIKRNPGESDTAFESRLAIYIERSGLLHRIMALGSDANFSMTRLELLKVLCVLEEDELTSRGFVVGAGIELEGKTYRIDQIVVTTGRKPEIVVHTWLVRPWTKSTNQGRPNRFDARRILKAGKPLPPEAVAE